MSNIYQIEMKINLGVRKVGFCGIKHWHQENGNIACRKMYGSRIREGKLASHDPMLLQPHQPLIIGIQCVTTKRVCECRDKRAGTQSGAVSGAPCVPARAGTFPTLSQLFLRTLLHRGTCHFSGFFAFNNLIL